MKWGVLCSPWLQERELLGSRAWLHSQDTRDNKLIAEIGERHLSIKPALPLCMQEKWDSSLSRTQGLDKAGACML
jgi:hypothetical protein